MVQSLLYSIRQPEDRCWYRLFFTDMRYLPVCQVNLWHRPSICSYTHWHLIYFTMVQKTEKPPSGGIFRVIYWAVFFTINYSLAQNLSASVILYCFTNRTTSLSILRKYTPAGYTPRSNSFFCDDPFMLWYISLKSNFPVASVSSTSASAVVPF